jgi:signal transduction histidine kinase/ligand-binding sensor domain-containing protein
LVRFDGIRFREFAINGETPFRGNLVRAIAEDLEQNLWVGTIGAGLAVIAKDGRVIRHSTVNGFPSNDVGCVEPDRANAIWVCTGNGLVQFAAGHERIYTTTDGLPEARVRDTCQATDGTRWVAGIDFGLSRSDGSRFVPFSRIPGAADFPVTALQCTGDGAVWAGTRTGLYRIQGDSISRYTSSQGLADDSVLSLAESNDGVLWIGSRYGVSRYRNGEISTYSTADGLSHSSVLSLLLDREGSLWAGTLTGLDQFTNSPVTPFTRKEGLPGNDTTAVLEDAGGNLWVGTLNEGLGQFDGKRFQAITTREGLASNRVLSLAIDGGGDIWAGTGNGVSRIRAGHVIQTYRGALASTDIRSVFVDSGGTIWAGADSGLFRLHGARFEAEGTLHAPIVALGGGRQIRLFVGTVRRGFLYLNGSSFTNAVQIDSRRTVRSFYIDHHRHVAWMGTVGRGLIRWENGKVTYYRISDGLYDGSIYGILHDLHGNLWFASSKGIFRISESELNQFAEGKIQMVHSVPFSTGQFRFECQEMSQPAALLSHDGRMWFSTTNGLVAVDPERIPRNEVPPPVRIESAFVNGERTDNVGGSQLKPWEKNLQIRYTGLSFVNPEKVTFHYMLEGYDHQWTDAGARREAFFTNLPPGKYRFRVIATNADGVRSLAAGLISFSIQPYYYQRGWFYASVLGSFAVLLWLTWQRRLVRLKREFAAVLGERARIARELHDTLVQQLSGVMMQLQALRARLPASREKMVLSDIIRDAEACAIEARSTLWELRSHTTQRNFSASLCEAARKLTKGRPIGLVLEVPEIEIPGGRAIEYQLLRIAGEAISNVVRHSQADTLTVGCSLHDGELELRVCDNGCGFASGDAPWGHFGLSGIRERASEIGADLSIESTPHGTALRVSVIFPIDPSERSEYSGNSRHSF